MESPRSPQNQLQLFFSRMLHFVAISVLLALCSAAIRSGESFFMGALLGLAAGVLVYVVSICSFVAWSIFAGIAEDAKQSWSGRHQPHKVDSRIPGPHGARKSTAQFWG